MMLRSCRRSEDVASMVRKGYWPDGCDEDLRAHIGGCGQCQEWILLTRSFQEARTESFDQIPQHSAFLLWWKSELRRRDATLAQVSRPMVLAHRFAIVVGMVAVAVFVTLALASFQDWFALEGFKRLWSGIHVDLLLVLASFGAGNAM